MPYKNKQDRYENQRLKREDNQSKLIDYLSTHPCIDCGESDPIVLEFDHISNDKLFIISKAICGSTRSWSSILNEIQKCEVRCANCHRKKTARDLNYYKIYSLYYKKYSINL